MAAKAEVRGAKELASAMRALGKSPSAAGRRRARTEAGKVIAKAYKANLVLQDFVVTGALHESIGVAEDERRRNRTLVGSRAGRFKKMVPSKYSHFPEFGTAPHYQPNRFGGIMHPGARPKPALRPALDQNIQEAAREYFKEVAADIERAVLRIGQRSRGARRP